MLSLRMAAGDGQLARVRSDSTNLRQDSDSLRDITRCAAICNRVEIVKFLIYNDIAVDSYLDRHGATMLHWES